MKKLIFTLFASFVTLLSACNMSRVQNALFEYNYDEMDFIQLEEPTEGQQMCIIDTTLGTIKAVLYPDLAPNTVGNFVERVNEGYYDNKLVYAVCDEAYFMTGAFDDTFNTGFTSDGQPIPAEYSVDLWPFKGALVAFYNTPGYSDSRFFVVNSFELTDEDKEMLRSHKNAKGEQSIPERLIDTMSENEGYWHISGCFSIFGQTIEGFDVIEKISSVAVGENDFRPLEDIYINSITLTEYAKTE